MWRVRARTTAKAVWQAFAPAEQSSPPAEGQDADLDAGVASACLKAGSSLSSALSKLSRACVQPNVTAQADAVLIGRLLWRQSLAGCWLWRAQAAVWARPHCLWESWQCSGACPSLHALSAGLSVLLWPLPDPTCLQMDEGQRSALLTAVLGGCAETTALLRDLPGVCQAAAAILGFSSTDQTCLDPHTQLGPTRPASEPATELRGAAGAKG